MAILIKHEGDIRFSNCLLNLKFHYHQTLKLQPFPPIQSSLHVTVLIDLLTDYDDLNTFFCFVNVFQGPNLYFFLTIWTFTFNLVTNFFLISYLVLLLSQFKNGRTRHTFQTDFIVLFPKRQERIASTL